jgi:cbb3-type cytochrome oxidase maturation protein
MDILYLLIPLSVVLVFAIGALFWWALESGQFEDLEGPAHRILMDDDAPLQAPDIPTVAGCRETRRNEHGKR